MKLKITVFLLLLPFYFIAQTVKNEYKTISGYITHNNKPLSNASVFVNNTMRYTVSDNKGFYNIKAKIGETISFSSYGLLKVFIIVEDVTETLNVDLKFRNTSSKLRSKSIPKLGNVNIGENSPEFVVLKANGQSLNKYASSLTRAVVEKFPVFYIKFNKYGEETLYLKGKELNGSAIWMIDNYEYDIPFPMLISEVKQVIVMNSEKGNPIIRVSTNIDYKKIKGIDFSIYSYTAEDFYNNDAKKLKKNKINAPYLDKYKRISKEKEVLELLEKTHSFDKDKENYHLNIYNYLKNKDFNNTVLIKVLLQYEVEAKNNAEILKTIAYKYQEINEVEKAIEIYKKIVKIRPNYLQSYRDLANAFLESKKYNEFWNTYKYYLQKGFKFDEDDISEIISSEIISAYNLDIENSTKKIRIDNPTKNIESDVRLVFEWNTSEAEFILEFVNPNLEIYSIENSIEENQKLITYQKRKGFTSKEIFIDKLNSGNYLVNLTYLGNKHNTPTSFKVTTYYNWGKENQSKKIEIFDISKENVKMQLLKLSRKFL